LRKSLAFTNVYSGAEHVFILEHYFASKSSAAAVGEAFGSGNPNKEAQNKATVLRLVTQFRDTESVWL
jgi:hypothetical protein